MLRHMLATFARVSGTEGGCGGLICHSYLIAGNTKAPRDVCRGELGDRQNVVSAQGGPTHHGFHAERLQRVKELRMVLVSQIVNGDYSACFYKRRLYILAVKNFRFSFLEQAGERNAVAHNRVRRDLAKTEAGVPLKVRKSRRMSVKEIVQIVAFVLVQATNKLPKIGFVPARLRPQAVHVDCNFHQDQSVAALRCSPTGYPVPQPLPQHVRAGSRARGDIGAARIFDLYSC
jgi:hypothetical protein